MARNIDSGRLSVMLWGQEIGQLCWNPAKGNSYFYFSPEYLSSGLDIAPLTASSKSPAARFAIYGNTDSAKYQKLPPFIADSLPDDWGNTLFDQWFAEHHYHEKTRPPGETLLRREPCNGCARIHPLQRGRLQSE